MIESDAPAWFFFFFPPPPQTKGTARWRRKPLCHLRERFNGGRGGVKRHLLSAAGLVSAADDGETTRWANERDGGMC